MYTINSNLGVLMEVPEVKEFLQSAAPQLINGPTVNYVKALTLEQMKAMESGMEELIQAVLDVANGKGTDFKPVDPKTVKPTIKNGMQAEYEIDDVDGKMFMLDHRFSGCFVIQFTKELNEDIKGSITCEGKELPYILTKVAVAGNMQMMGVFVRNICREYGREYILHFQDFVDTDGNQMEPADYVIKTASAGKPDEAYAKHDAVAQQAAEEGIVLLKNENGTLPLAKEAAFGFIGAEEFRMGAVGAGKINPRYAVRFGQAVEESSFHVDETAESCVVVISRASGENYDMGPFKGQYYLTDEEEQMLKAVTAKYKKVIAVVNSGYPMDVRWIENYGIDAAIWCGYPGMLGGRALVNVLNGTVNPSGKLPDTWSKDYYDIPSSQNFYVPPTPEEALDADHDVWLNTVYEEDIYVGYRYFETFDKPVAYPFGHGLSYTSFAINAEIMGRVDESAGAAGVQIRVVVKNSGTVSGKEVVQAYVAIPDGKLEQPAKRLAAFAKTKLLAPGEEQSIILEVNEARLTSFDEETSSYILEAGDYEFFVGSSIKELVCAGQITVPKSKIHKTVESYMQPPMEFSRLSKKKADSYPKGELSGILESHELTPQTVRKSIPDTEVIENTFVDSWSVEEMARFSVCASSGWGMQDVGVAGRVYRLEGRDIPYYAVSDGNNGVNINKKNIGMPTSNLVCATWNECLAYEVGRVIAEEAKENNVQMILAPAMNIHRNPLCGRHSEYFSEDPLLAGIMAGHQCKGLEEHGISASVKHVCCNGAESSRKRNQSILSVRALREIYLKAFEIALEIHQPDSIMTAYNACNGVFTAEDEELIQGIFRQEFGFDGFVMTDWNSYDTADVAKAVQAGNCWMTPGTTDSTYVAPIIEGVDGTIDETRLRQNVKRMYRVITRK